jgi:hypothetical protein
MSVKYFFRICNIVRVGDKGIQKIYRKTIVAYYWRWKERGKEGRRQTLK